MGEPDQRSCCCCPSRGPGSRSKRAPIPTLLFLLVSAVPIAIVVSLERSAAGFTYQTRGWIRECAKWDPEGRRFLASTFFSGGIVQLTSGDPDAAAGVLTERPVLTDPDVAGNASLGIYVDRDRGRLLVVYADLWGFRYSAVAAYELGSWSRLFLARLSRPGSFFPQLRNIFSFNAFRSWIGIGTAQRSRWFIECDGPFQSSILFFRMVGNPSTIGQCIYDR